MEKKRISDERLAELIRAAALRREVPVGLETRVMAQVILRDRRRRERRAIAANPDSDFRGAIFSLPGDRHGWAVHEALPIRDERGRTKIAR